MIRELISSIVCIVGGFLMLLNANTLSYRYVGSPGLYKLAGLVLMAIGIGVFGKAISEWLEGRRRK